MRRERRQPTKRELATITTRRPVLRRIPPPKRSTAPVLMMQPTQEEALGTWKGGLA